MYNQTLTSPRDKVGALDPTPFGLRFTQPSGIVSLSLPCKMSFFQSLFIMSKKWNDAITAPFSNIRILSSMNKFFFFATVNRMFGGSSHRLTNVEHCFVVRTGTQRFDYLVRSWEEEPNNWLTVTKAHLSVELWILMFACYWKAP